MSAGGPSRQLDFPSRQTQPKHFRSFAQTENLFVTRPQSLRPDLIDAALAGPAVRVTVSALGALCPWLGLLPYSRGCSDEKSTQGNRGALCRLGDLPGGHKRVDVGS